MASMPQQIEDYVRGLGLDAYVVGGTVRDELLGIESKDPQVDVHINRFAASVRSA